MNCIDNVVDDPIIEVRNASKVYKEIAVLNNVSASFQRGKIHGIIGRNGSGKTVLLKCITGFIPLTKGEIKVNGKHTGKDMIALNDMGIIIDAPGFLSGYSGYKNLKMLAMINGNIANHDIEKSMALVGLEWKDKKHVSKYSMGMRQRLGIAQAIMEDPSILLLDEPMNGLDNQGVEDMRKLFKELRDQGKTILLTSHSKEDIDILCDSVYEMDRGNARKVR